MNKVLTIGITGHRDIIEMKQLKEDIYGLFIEVLNKYDEVRLLSPLADGADRFVADIYLDVFKENSKLSVPMPFHQERYMEDFNIKSKINFLEYLTIADEIIEVESSHGCNYKSVGIYVVDKCDVLVALWDATFNNKSGGTGDIVTYARSMKKDIKHFLCERLQKNNMDK